MKLFLTFFIFTLYLSPSRCGDQEDCQRFVDNLVKKYPALDANSLPPQESYYVQFSGRNGPLDFGRRELCEAQSSMVYYVLVQDANTYDNVHFQTESGICVAKQCTPDIIRNTPGILDNLFKLNNWPIKGDLYDVNGTPPKTEYFYYSVYLHATLISLVAIGTGLAILIRTIKFGISRRYGRAYQDHIPWLIDAFDLYSSFKGLFQTAKEQKLNENLSIFGFLRVVGMWWVAATHVWGITHDTSRNPGPACIGECEFIRLGPYGVDFFFFMGGFLAVYTLGSKFQKEDLTLWTLISHMKHRLIRIWPPCMIATIFYWLVLPFLVNGPMMGRYTGVSAYCDTLWRT